MKFTKSLRTPILKNICERRLEGTRTSAEDMVKPFHASGALRKFQEIRHLDVYQGLPDIFNKPEIECFESIIHRYVPR